MDIYLGQCHVEGDFRTGQKRFRLVGTLYGTLSFESREPIILKDSRLELTAMIACENPDAPYQPSCVPPFMHGDRVRLVYHLATGEFMMERYDPKPDPNGWCIQPMFW